MNLFQCFLVLILLLNLTEKENQKDEDEQIEEEMKNVFKIEPTTKISRATKYSAGYDITIFDKEIILNPGWNKIDLGFSLTDYFPKTKCLKLQFKSSTVLKYPMLQIHPGLVDSDYRNNICALICNTSLTPVTLDGKIQLIQFTVEDYCVLSGFESQEERKGGFGSTTEKNNNISIYTGLPKGNGFEFASFL